jgi:DNA-damage-inducible protein J
MAKTTFITARIDPALKRKTEKIFEHLGLTTTQAITLFYKQVNLRKGLPFAVEIPNAETDAAIRNALGGRDLHEARDAGDLISQLES